MKKIDIVLIGLAVVEHGLNLCVHAYVLVLVLKFGFGIHFMYV